MSATHATATTTAVAAAEATTGDAADQAAAAVPPDLLEAARTICRPHPHRAGYGLAGVDPASVWGRPPGSTPVLFVGLKDPNWLARPQTRHPAMISRNTLAHGKRRSPWPQANVPWALDSGAFTAWTNGGWDITAKQWANEIRHHHRSIGNLVFAAGMDWLVTPAALHATGKTADYHLRATVENYCAVAAELDQPDDPYLLPTVQGRDAAEYETCLHAYLDAGVDLCRRPLVGAGSLAGGRRDWAELLDKLAVLGEFGVTRVHAFGVYDAEKLARLGTRCVSVDSMAWSRRGRALAPRPECTHGGKQENNCLEFSQQWADEQHAQARMWAAGIAAALAWLGDQPAGEHFSVDAVDKLNRRLDAISTWPLAPIPERGRYRHHTPAPATNTEATEPQQLTLFTH